MQHLVKAETGTLTICRKQAAAGDARRDVGTPDDVRLDTLIGHLRSDGRAKMPAEAVLSSPQTVLPTPAGATASPTSRTQWAAFAGELSPENAEAPLMAHPRAGALRADGAARFTGAHIAHHVHQLARLRAAEGFPDA